jgi:GH15 family glucan-1,4-alpha-glucosidase
VARQVVLGNGRLTVALDDRMRVRDLSYPKAGLENHVAGHFFRIGVWTDGTFSWVDDGWQVQMKYLPETLVTRCTARSASLGIELEVNDTVHQFLDLFLRKVTVTGLGHSAREVRVFFSQDFHIYGVDTGDTAMYEPDSGSIVHYKGRRYFLINGQTNRNEGIFQFATGYKESPGKQGTWRDAEDGLLEGNPIAQGAVDSTVSFRAQLLSESPATVYYWIACGRNVEEVGKLDGIARRTGVEQLFLEVENYWSAWVNKKEVDLTPLPRNVARMFKTSLLVMRTHVDDDGAVIASCDSDILGYNRDTYSYVWPRDGALAALAFDAAGFHEVSRTFFLFCNDIITQRGFFHHKYLADGSRGSSWHAWVDSKGNYQLPIQEDETALVLYALWRHYQKYRDIEFIGKLYANLVVRATEFILEHRDETTGLPKPSFDLWEEKIGVFTSTAATVCAALTAAARFAQLFYDSKRQELLSESATQMKQAILTHLYDRRLGRFIKAIYPDGSRDLTIDSSLMFAFLYGPFEAREEAVTNSVHAIIDKLRVGAGGAGIARYENDEYYRVSSEVTGNPWFVCTIWLARWYIARAESIDELNKGLEILEWVTDHSLTSGILSEQLDPYTGVPISASPLVWSHAEFVIALSEYLDRYREISPRGRII